MLNKHMIPTTGHITASWEMLKSTKQGKYELGLEYFKK